MKNYLAFNCPRKSISNAKSRHKKMPTEASSQLLAFPFPTFLYFLPSNPSKTRDEMSFIRSDLSEVSDKGGVHREREMAKISCKLRIKLRIKFNFTVYLVDFQATAVQSIVLSYPLPIYTAPTFKLSLSDHITPCLAFPANTRPSCHERKLPLAPPLAALLCFALYKAPA
jgi:hypothetical protein